MLKMMVGNNLNDLQLQQLVDRTIIQADTVPFRLILFRTMMARFRMRSSRSWSRTWMWVVSLKSIKFDNRNRLMGNQFDLLIECMNLLAHQIHPSQV